MFTPYQCQHTPRAVGRALSVNHSRAIGRALSVNHSQAASAALRV